MEVDLQIIQKIMQRSIIAGDCILWQGPCSGYGYGKLPHNGGHIYAHRFIWESKHGKVPNGLCVLHTCDVTRCVNVDHLFLGTRMDNYIDMVAKGRDNTLRNKLSEDNVRYIRSELSAGTSTTALAKAFGVDRKTIYNISAGVSWSWLP